MIETKQYVICTSVCGGRDTLCDPKVVHDDVDYIAFVDREYECKVWKQYPVKISTHPLNTNRRSAKPYKVIPQAFMAGWEYFAWQDANIETMVHPRVIAERHMTTNMAVFSHTSRNCIYDEATVVNQGKMDNEELLIKQVEFYKGQGYPPKNGLYALGFNIRRDCEETLSLGLEWMEQINQYSSRDQISFPYVLWKLGIRVSGLPGNRYRGGYPRNDIARLLRRHIG